MGLSVSRGAPPGYGLHGPALLSASLAWVRSLLVKHEAKAVGQEERPRRGGRCVTAQWLPPRRSTETIFSKMEEHRVPSTTPTSSMSVALMDEMSVDVVEEDDAQQQAPKARVGHLRLIVSRAPVFVPLC